MRVKHRSIAGFEMARVACPTCGGSGLVACAKNHPEAMKGYSYGDFPGVCPNNPNADLGVKICGHCRGKGYHEHLPTSHTSVQPGSTRVQ